MPPPPTLPTPELVAPNLHVAMVHFPLGVLAAGVAIELFSFLWPRSSIRLAGRWMILLGALAGIPAAFSGIYALRQVARVDLDVQGRVWADVKAASPVLGDPAIWYHLKTHTLYQSISTAVAVLAAITWMGSGDAARRTLRWPVLLLLLGSLAGMVTGAWFSGEAIYTHGAGVEHGWEQTEANTGMKPFSRVEGWFPPPELHIIAAGTTVALAMLAVGASFRKLAVIHADLAGGTLPAEVDDPHGSADLARSFNPNLAVGRPVVLKVPASRAWLVAFLVAAVTSLGGWFVLFRAAGVTETVQKHSEVPAWKSVPQVLWGLVEPTKTDGHWQVGRRFFHVAGAGAIILLPLVLAGLARFAPRRRVALGVVTGLLVAAVAAQVWFGVLLLYDGPDGTVTKFNDPKTEGAEHTPATSQPTTQPTQLSA